MLVVPIATATLLARLQLATNFNMRGTDPINVELLIELVRNQEHLYDSSSPNYNNSSLKENSWSAIALTLNSTPNEIKKKWKNLRDIFARVYTKWSNQSADGRRHDAKWVHFSALMFLADTLRPRRPSMQRANVLSFQKFEEIDEIETKPDISQLELPSFNCDSPHTSIVMPELSGGLKSPPDQDFPAAKRQRFEEESLDLESQRDPDSGVTSDVNEAFGRLVTASLRDLPRDKQALLRFKISELLFNLGDS